jgi:hypothetical protein
MKDIFGSEVVINPDVPENEVRLVTRNSIVKLTNCGPVSSGKITKEGIVPFTEEDVFTGQLEVVAPKVLQPTSIEKISAAERFAPDSDGVRSLCRPLDFLLRPSLLMRRMGYTRHQMTCAHERKKMSEFSLKWRCADCGMEF